MELHTDDFPLSLNRKFYDYLIKMLSIAKIGLTFSYDAYAIEDYKKVQELSESALEHFMDLKLDRRASR